MLALITTKEGEGLILYGPFNSEEQAERYARYHKIWGCCLMVKLHDSGDALDA